MDHAKYHAKPLMNTPVVLTPDTTIEIDGESIPAEIGEPLIEAVNRAMAARQQTFPQVCYLKPMGAIGSCDTCMVELNGELARACESRVAPGQIVHTRSDRADVAQREAFDRLLHNHDLYCTVCDNNNQNCTVHNTTKELAVKHQARKFEHQPYPQDHSNPFYRYDPDQCILCGRCVEACQNVQVNETLTIDWDARNPARPLGRHRADRRLLLRLLRPLHHRLPLQRAHGKRHARQGRLSHHRCPPKPSTT